MDELLSALTSNGSPFELSIRSDGAPNFRHAPLTLRDLYGRVRKRPQDTVVLVVDSTRVTLAELLRAADRFGANCMKRRSGRPQTGRVAIVLPNGLEFIAALIGVTEAGLAAVLVPYDTDVAAVSVHIDAVACDLVVTTPELSHALAGLVACPCEVAVWDEVKAMESPAPIKERSAAPVDEMVIRPEGAAIIAFTSGSSGRPKPVLISHRALIAGLWNMMLAGAWTAKRNRRLEEATASPPPRPVGGQPCSLLIAPLTHVSGYSHFLLSLATGGRIVITASGNALHMARLACQEVVKSLVGATPRLILEILDAPVSAGAVLPIEFFGIHGSALRKGLVDEIRMRVPSAKFSTGYGLTETSGSIAATGGAELLALPETCGPVLPTVEIEIVGEDGEARPPGSAGEIRVRGAMLFDGYYGTSTVAGGRDDLGWFLTGDIGVLDRSRYLTLLERGSATIRVGSRGLYCSDIEKYIDNGQWGDEIVAVGAEGGQQLVIGILSRRRVDTKGLKLQLHHEFRIPGDSITIICRSELPRTSSGKIDRRALLALSAEAMTDQV